MKIRKNGVTRIATCLHNLGDCLHKNGSGWKVGQKIIFRYLLAPVDGPLDTRVEGNLTLGCGRWSRPLGVTIFFVDEEADLVLFDVPVELDSLPAIQLGITPPLIEGRIVGCFGFPLGLYDTGETNNCRPSPVKLVRQIDEFYPGKPNWICCSLGGAEFGMSGGAVFLDSGELVALIKGRTTEETPRCIVVSLENIVANWQ